MKTKKAILLTIIMICLIGLMYAYRIFNKNKANPEILEKSRIITVATLQGAEEGVFLRDVAEEKGFFKKHNIEIKTVIADKSANELLLSGNADVYIGGIGAALSDFLNGPDFAWIGTVTRHPYNMVGVSRYPKNQANMIKKVAITRMAGGNHLQVLDALKQLGVDASNVEFVVTPIAARTVMLEKGNIDFTVVDADYSGKSEGFNSFNKFTIYSPSEIFSDSYARGFVSTKKNVSAKSSELKDFLAAMHDALDYIDSHPEEMKILLQSKYAFSSQGAEIFYHDYADARRGVNWIPNESLIQDTAATVLRNFQPAEPNKDIAGFVYSDMAQSVINK